MDTICIAKPEELDPHTTKGEPITGGTARFRGRAVVKLAGDHLPKQPWCAFSECPDEDFDLIGRLHLDPYGNLFPCQGIVVGNLHDQLLSDIVRNYSPQVHSIIAPIRRGGPAEMVRTFDLPLRAEYHDACHLCYLARKHLRPRFLNELGPALVYGGGSNRAGVMRSCCTAAHGSH